MKRITTIFCAMAMILFMGNSLTAGNTLTVSSDQDSGAGTLRQLIADAEAGDSIVIPGTYNIVLNSEIMLTKNLKINGQGATVQVADPGVTQQKLILVGESANDTEETAVDVRIEQLILKPGNITGTHTTLSNPLNCGAGITLFNYSKLTAEDITIEGGKGNYGGALFVNNASSTISLLNCSFINNEATTTNGGACILKGTAIVDHCIFDGNKSGANGSAIAAYSGSKISNCYFRNNESAGTSGGAVVNYATSGSIEIENSTFEGNTNINTTTATSSNTAGSAAFVSPAKAAVSILTNCTFYKNSAKHGAVFNYKGTMTIVNCTFAANTSPAGYGSAFVNSNVSTDSPDITLVNNIFAYNYDTSGNDIFMGTNSTKQGSHNIIGKNYGSIELLTDTVDFSYGTTPAEDSPLFSSYTTDGESRKIPVLDPTTRTIILAVNSTANSTGTPDYGTPDIVPGTDQRGVVRNIPPCVGAYEYKLSTGIGNGHKDNMHLYAVSGSLIISGTTSVNALDVFDISGKKVLSTASPAETVSLYGIPAGIYIVRAYTTKTTIQQKIIIR